MSMWMDNHGWNPWMTTDLECEFVMPEPIRVTA